MTQRTLTLIRHGQYARAPQPPGADPDGPLTDLGRAQAQATARRLQGLPIAAIYHSTLQRAAETAAIIGEMCPGVPLRPDDLLRECVPSIPPGFDHLFRAIPPEVLERGAAQARAAFDAYFQPPGDEAEHILIVSSGNLINWLVCQTLGAPHDAWLHADLQHCAVSEIILGPPRHRLLVRHNDAGHLPADMHTYT